jgi:hypothetical protein
VANGGDAGVEFEKLTKEYQSLLQKREQMNLLERSWFTKG